MPGLLLPETFDRGPVVRAGTSAAFLTGGWREQRPVLTLDRCVHCMLCWLYCPDSAIQVSDGRVTGIDLDHCKGCGVCAAVCPDRAGAIVMSEEAKG